jgi:hypothetical protein
MIPDWKDLLDPNSAVVSFATGEEEAIDNLARAAPDGARGIVRIVRGRRCTTREGLFYEWAAALQFPSYFGENWDAFEECLSDLEWLPGKGLVLLVTQADRILELAPHELNTWGDVLKMAAAEWRAIHPDAPFHLVFHAEEGNEAKAKDRLRVAGLILPH